MFKGQSGQDSKCQYTLPFAWWALAGGTEVPQGKLQSTPSWPSHLSSAGGAWGGKGDPVAGVREALCSPRPCIPEAVASGVICVLLTQEYDQ